MYRAAPLPFNADALTGLGISQETVHIHYHKHHCGYAAKLNAVAAATPTLVGDPATGAPLPLPALLQKAPLHSPVYNLAAQIINHDLYWCSLSPARPRLAEQSALYGKIYHDFGSFASLEKQFSALATAHFGSGWVWLCYHRGARQLQLVETHDAVHPTSLDPALCPLWVCDVWEHAYYVDARNDRAAYVAAFWRAINWAFAEDQYAAAISASTSRL